MEQRKHRRALLEWLDELDAEHGAPTAEDLAAADALLDEAEALEATAPTRTGGQRGGHGPDAGETG